MRFFTLIDFHHFIVGLFLGCMAALVLYLAFRYGPKGGRTEGGDLEGLEGETEEFPDGLKVGGNRMPPVLVFVFIGFAVWFIFYVIFFGILGGPV